MPPAAACCQGMIDDQVISANRAWNKADMAIESAAAVAGGLTSFIDMPNTNPPTLNRDALETNTAAPTAFAARTTASTWRQQRQPNGR